MQSYARLSGNIGDRGGTVVKVLVRSQLVSLEFFIDIKSFRSHYGPGVNSASNRNEYQENFLGVKVAVVTKSGNLNFLEPSGPLQACNGTGFIREHLNQSITVSTNSVWDL